MDADLKARWAAALRSRDYPQGKYYLERDGRFCCMGVLCKVLGEPTGPDDGAICGRVYDPVRKALGVGPYDGTGQVLRDLSSMNDDEGQTFAQIADYIDANL